MLPIGMIMAKDSFTFQCPLIAGKLLNLVVSEFKSALNRIKQVQYEIQIIRKYR